MLSPDKLAAPDLSLWLRSGEEAAQRLAISQPTVSRRVRQSLELFELKLLKREQEWELRGSPTKLQLLAMERHVHQTSRWLDQGALRIEGTYWSGPLLLRPEPPGWPGAAMPSSAYSGRCNGCRIALSMPGWPAAPTGGKTTTPSSA